MTGWRVTICRSLVQIIGTDLWYRVISGPSTAQHRFNNLSDLQGWCIYCSFFGDLPPTPSPNLPQNLARSAAVASKPYKMLTGTLCTSKQILTNSESIFLSLNVLANFQFNSPNLQVTCFYIELMEVKSPRCSGLRGAYNKW